MSGEQGGIQTSTLIIIVCIVSVFALAVYCAYRTSKKHEEAVQAFARSHGWDYARFDKQGIKQKVEAVFTTEEFDPTFIVTVENGQHNLFLFNCGYNNREHRKSRGRGTACLIESPSFRSLKQTVEIFPYSWIDEKLGSGEVKMDNPEFNKKFIVLSKDPEAAKQIVNSGLQAVLLEHAAKPIYNPVRIGLGPSGAVLMSGENAEPARWLDLIELSRKVEGVIR